MSQSESWTIGRLLAWTTEYLEKNGADSPRLDAELLLAEARDCQRIELYTAFGEVAGERTRTTFRELVRRRCEGTPVAYLLGRREFYSLSFRVTPDVLIPRPETELLVVTLLDRAKECSSETESLTLADVGTGSGIIAVCAARYLGTCQITAIDISAKALAVAKTNAAEHGVAGNISFVEGDLLESLPAEPTFDLIVSNPPYVSDAEMQSLARDVRDFEPHLALGSGATGTEIIGRLIPQAAERLRSGGWLLIEISPMIQTATEALLAEHGGFDVGPTIKDLAGHGRIVQARRLP